MTYDHDLELSRAVEREAPEMEEDAPDTRTFGERFRDYALLHFAMGEWSVVVE